MKRFERFIEEIESDLDALKDWNDDKDERFWEQMKVLTEDLILDAQALKEAITFFKADALAVKKAYGLVEVD